MSYSFNFQVDTKAEAKARVAFEMRQIVAQQPSHAKDQAEAVKAAHVFIDMLADKPEQVIQVSMHGALGWEWSKEDPHGLDRSPAFSSASFGISAYHTARKAA